MCMCKQPTINGQPGYSWNGEQSATRDATRDERQRRELATLQNRVKVRRRRGRTRIEFLPVVAEGGAA